MAKIGVFYGSSTGYTSELAQKVAKALGAEAHCYDISCLEPSLLNNYDLLVLGSSTWGIGDLQDDWEGFLPKIKGLDLSGKAVALFGCGDADSYEDSFCEALAVIKSELSDTGCRFVGAYEPVGYTYSSTRSEEDGKLIGLCIDESNQPELTDERLALWLEALAPER